MPVHRNEQGKARYQEMMRRGDQEQQGVVQLQLPFNKLLFKNTHDGYTLRL